jgi:OmpA-OmpF porin, OOP family
LKAGNNERKTVVNYALRLHSAHAALALAVLTTSLPAAAQTSAGPGPEIGSLKPGRGSQAIGLNIGRSDYGAGCGLLPGCEDGDRSVRLYGRSMVTDNFGAELGLLDMGRIDLGGGSTRAQGINLSLVGRLPLWDALSAYGKVGTTYGHTSTSVSAGSGLRGGSENGFGLSYGAGLSWDFSPRISAVLEWDSHDFRFANGGRDPVRATSLGLQYRY